MQPTTVRRDARFRVEPNQIMFCIYNFKSFIEVEVLNTICLLSSELLVQLLDGFVVQRLIALKALLGMPGLERSEVNLELLEDEVQGNRRGAASWEYKLRIRQMWFTLIPPCREIRPETLGPDDGTPDFNLVDLAIG